MVEVGFVMNFVLWCQVIAWAKLDQNWATRRWQQKRCEQSAWLVTNKRFFESALAKCFASWLQPLSNDASASNRVELNRRLDFNCLNHYHFWEATWESKEKFEFTIFSHDFPLGISLLPEAKEGEGGRKVGREGWSGREWEGGRENERERERDKEREREKDSALQEPHHT